MKLFLKLIYLLILGVTFCACSSDKDKYTEIVSEWNGKEIIFPELLTDVLTGDTISTNDVDFTILTYIDSVGCTSCAMKIPLWNYFLNSLDSICTDKDYNVIFVINSSDPIEISYLLKREEYYRPVVCDSLDFLNKTNKLPDEPMFRTFLLDRNNRILAIGNPIYNPRVGDLYQSIITGVRTFTNPGNYTIYTDKPKIDIGKIKTGTNFSTTVSLYNKSGNDVPIREIIASCPCTQATLNDSIIPANGQLPIKITFREDSAIGEFSRNIHIFYSDSKNPIVLEISGAVIQ